MSFKVQEMTVSYGIGAKALADSVATALVANNGRLHLTGRGHKTTATALQALRLASEGAPLLAHDPTGVASRIHRTRTGPATSSRTTNKTVRWDLHVQALPAGFAIQLDDIAGTAPMPAATATTTVADALLPDPNGPGATYLFHPRLRIAFHEAS